MILPVLQLHYSESVVDVHQSSTGSSWSRLSGADRGERSLVEFRLCDGRGEPRCPFIARGGGGEAAQGRARSRHVASRRGRAVGNARTRSIRTRLHLLDQARGGGSLLDHAHVVTSCRETRAPTRHGQHAPAATRPRASSA